ncbi:hypothetical protein BDD12DRAFT_912188 [Trichophaea hybrida]|nr:hypothetical protein BDD12DRAFT_912188 [Trichophaea hybrida]
MSKFGRASVTKVYSHWNAIKNPPSTYRMSLIALYTATAAVVAYPRLVALVFILGIQTSTPQQRSVAVNVRPRPSPPPVILSSLDTVFDLVTAAENLPDSATVRQKLRARWVKSLDEQFANLRALEASSAIPGADEDGEPPVLPLFESSISSAADAATLLGSNLPARRTCAPWTFRQSSHQTSSSDYRPPSTKTMPLKMSKTFYSNSISPTVPEIADLALRLFHTLADSAPLSGPF